MGPSHFLQPSHEGVVLHRHELAAVDLGEGLHQLLCRHVDGVDLVVLATGWATKARQRRVRLSMRAFRPFHRQTKWRPAASRTAPAHSPTTGRVLNILEHLVGDVGLGVVHVHVGDLVVGLGRHHEQVHPVPLDVREVVENVAVLHVGGVEVECEHGLNALAGGG